MDATSPPMDDREIRRGLIRKLDREVSRLPNGLLHRLINDAREFNVWNMDKKSSRQKARLDQFQRQKARNEEAYWREVKKLSGGTVR